jgi:hypothetical protein
MAEMERFSRHASHSFAPPKHSRLAPAVAILLVLSLAFARFIRHRRRSQRSLSRALAFKSFLAEMEISVLYAQVKVSIFS